jgi:AAA domain
MASEQAPGNIYTFTDSPAVRVATPLFVGLVGPSSTGKTYSALRLATGMQRVTGGKIFGIDTESNRMLHYAPLPGEKPDPTNGKFEFTHVPFSAPYESLKYLAAIRHCVSRGAKVIVVDSMSHEHEGVGGVLEQHEAEAIRLAEKFKTTVDAMSQSAWAVPKANRRKLINTLLTETAVNVIFCFRAKKKLKMATKEEKKAGNDAITPLGFLPIAGEEFMYEMMLKCLLLPGASGTPEWTPAMPGEKEMVKIPKQFLHVFETKPQLSEEIGQQLAEWAAGGDTKPPTDAEVADRIAAAKAATSLEEHAAVVESLKGKPWTTQQRRALTKALNDKKAELTPS